jgi:hypothetical protein
MEYSYLHRFNAASPSPCYLTANPVMIQLEVYIKARTCANASGPFDLMGVSQ